MTTCGGGAGRRSVGSRGNPRSGKLYGVWGSKCRPRPRRGGKEVGGGRGSGGGERSGGKVTGAGPCQEVCWFFAFYVQKEVFLSFSQLIGSCCKVVGLYCSPTGAPGGHVRGRGEGAVCRCGMVRGGTCRGKRRAHRGQCVVRAKGIHEVIF